MADPDALAVHTIDADALTELAVTPLDGEPAQLLPLADGRVLISMRDKNRLAVFEIPEANDAPLEPRRLNVAGFAVGVIFVGRSVGYVGLGGAGGLSNACGPGASGNSIKSIRYEAIRRADKEGSIEFVMGRGFVETSTCRVAIEERWSVQPARMAGGVILGFRTRCDACAEGSRDALHVVTPQLSDFLDRIAPVEHHTFSLEKGASKILKGFTATHDSLSFKVPDWSDVADRACAKPEKRCSHGVRIEVSRAENEAKATVLVSPNINWNERR